MRQKLLILVCIIGMQTYAQELMRIIKNDGTTYDFSVNNVESMLFFTPEQINVVGDWVGYNDIAMRCYSLDQDGTMRYKYYSMTQSNNYEVEGEYVYNDNVLTLKYSGNTLPIEIISYNDTILVSGAHEVYYKVLEPIYNMKTTDDPINIGNEGDVIKYVDNCVVGVENNKIKPLKDGTGYAIVEDAVTKSLKAYRIDVSLVLDPPVDWSLYFKKSESDIIEEFGEPNQKNDTKHTRTYTNFNSAIQYVAFIFSEDYSMVTNIQVSFYDVEKMQNYCETIAEKYIMNSSTSTRSTYFDSDRVISATIMLAITMDKDNDRAYITYYDLAKNAGVLPATIDWTQFFKKTRDEITTEFGEPDFVDEDDGNSIRIEYTKGYNAAISGLTFYVWKETGKVWKIIVDFDDRSKMQNYCDEIEEKYIYHSDSEYNSTYANTYYNSDNKETATIRLRVSKTQASGSITYVDME